MAKNRNNAKEFHGFWRVSYPRICGYEFQTRNDLDCRGGTSLSWKAPGLTAHSLSTRPQGSRPTDSCSSTPPSHGHAQDPPRGLILTSNGLSRSNTPVQCCYCHTSNYSPEMQHWIILGDALLLYTDTRSATQTHTNDYNVTKQRDATSYLPLQALANQLLSRSPHFFCFSIFCILKDRLWAPKRNNMFYLFRFTLHSLPRSFKPNRCLICL